VNLFKVTETAAILYEHVISHAYSEDMSYRMLSISCVLLSMWIFQLHYDVLQHV